MVSGGRLALEGWGVLLSGEKNRMTSSVMVGSDFSRACGDWIGSEPATLMIPTERSCRPLISWHFSCFRKSLQCPSTIT